MADSTADPKNESQNSKTEEPKENGGSDLKASDEAEHSLNADEEDLEEVENEAGGDYESPLKAAMRALQFSTSVKILGFKRAAKIEDDLAIWYKFFKELVEVDVPELQPPGADDQWIIFKMKTVQDKHKLFQYVKKNKYEGVKLRVKTITIKEAKDDVETELLPEDEALDLLYPARNVIYADQLKDKFTKMKSLIEEELIPIKDVEKFTKQKKYIKSIKTREMVPFTPIDGYENNILVYIEKNAETGEVNYGLRAVRSQKSDTKTKIATCIVPLDKCLSVPRQVTLVAKNIINGLTTVGLEAYCPSTKEGEVLGYALRITNQGHFMLTVIIKKPGAIAFHEFTPEKIVLTEGESLGEPYRALIQNKVKEISEKLTKFYENEGKNFGIRSVYATLLPEQVILYQMSSGVWNNLPRPEYVVGDQQLIDKMNGVALKIQWDRERHTEIYNSVLPLFDPFNFNSTTKIYLMSPNKQIGYYFAKKCSHVTQIGVRTTDVIIKNKPSDAPKNIDFIVYTTKLKKPVSVENTVVIWWPFLLATSVRKNKKFSLVQQFLNFGITSMVFITYWGKHNENIDKYHTHMESVYSKLRITRIIPFDVEPYREGYGFFVFFKGLLDEAANRPAIKAIGNKVPPKFARGGRFRRPDVTVGPRDFRVMRRVEPFERQGVYAGPKRHVSALQRLGPRPDYQSRPAESPWSQESSTQKAWNQIEHVAGVVQNLQSMAQQMQAFMEHKQQPQHQASPNWSMKRKYPDEEDSYYQDNRSGSGGRWQGGNNSNVSSGMRSGESWNSSVRGGGAASVSGEYTGRWQNISSSTPQPRDNQYDMIDYNHHDKRRREDTSFGDRRDSMGGSGGGGGSVWGSGQQQSQSNYSTYGNRPATWGAKPSVPAPSYYDHSATPNHPPRNYY